MMLLFFRKKKTFFLCVLTLRRAAEAFVAPPVAKPSICVQRSMMLLPEDVSLSVAAVQATSVFIASVVGFGDALMAVPLLATMGVDLSVAAPLVSCTSVWMFSGSLLKERTPVGKWNVSAALTAGALLGIPCGVHALSNVDPQLIQHTLGAGLLAYAFWSRFFLSGPRRKLPVVTAAIPFGFVAGLLGGSVSSPGPPAIVFSRLADWDPVTSRVMLFRFFLPVQILATLGFYKAGLLTPAILHQTLVSAPLVFAAITVGSRLNGKLKPAVYANLITGILSLVGLLCLFSSS